METLLKTLIFNCVNELHSTGSLFSEQLNSLQFSGRSVRTGLGKDPQVAYIASFFTMV